MPTILPPPEFTGPQKLAIVEHVMSHDEIQKICPQVTGRVLMRGDWFNGCGRIVNNVCYVWRVDNAAVAVHERAHCNGWDKNHTGGH